MSSFLHVLLDLACFSLSPSCSSSSSSLASSFFLAGFFRASPGHLVPGADLVLRPRRPGLELARLRRPAPSRRGLPRRPRAHGTSTCGALF